MGTVETDTDRAPLLMLRWWAIVGVGFALLVLAGYPAVAGPAERATCLGEASETAIAACRSELRARPGDYEIYTTLGKHLNTTSRFQEAVDVFSEALRFHPRDRRLEQLLEISKSNLEEQRWAEARRQSAQDSAGEKSAELKLQRLFCQTRRGREALEACERVLRTSPDDPGARRRHAELLAALKPQRDASPAKLEELPADQESPQSNRQLVAIIQERLNQLGFDAGPVDGLAGRRTYTAAEQFASHSEIPSTLGSELAEALGGAVEQDSSATSMLADAQELAQVGELDSALETTRTARSMAPWNAEIEMFEAELETSVAMRDEKARGRSAKIQEILAAIDQALVDRDLDTAETYAIQGIERYPDEQRFKDLGEYVAAERDTLEIQRQQRLTQATSLLEQSVAARDAGELDRALDLAAQGLLIVPDNTQLLALRDDIESRQATDERERLAAQERAAKVEELHRLARDARTAGKLEESARHLDEALALAPDNPALRGLRETVEADQTRIENERAAAVARKARVAQSLAEAQQLQSENNLEESLALVNEGLALEPNHQELLALKSTIELKQRRIEQAHREEADRNRRADELLADARDAGDGGDFDDALDRVELALELVPERPDLLALQQELRTERARLIANRREAERLLAEARKLRQSGDLASSLSVFDEGLAKLPGDPELTSYRRELELELGRIRQAEAEAEARAREARNLLGLGREALRVGDLEGARYFAERGLAGSPEDEDLLSLLASVEGEELRIREAQARQELLATWASQVLDEARDIRSSGDLDSSLTRIDEGLARVPDHSELLELRIAVNADIARREEDRASFEKLISQSREVAASGDLDFADGLLDRAEAILSDDPRLESLRLEIENQRAVALTAQVVRYGARAQRRYQDAQSISGTDAAALEKQLTALEDAQTEVDRGLQLAPSNSTLVALADRIGSERRRIEKTLSAGRERAQQAEAARRELHDLEQSLAVVMAKHQAQELATRVLAQKVLEKRARANQ